MLYFLLECVLNVYTVVDENVIGIAVLENLVFGMSCYFFSEVKMLNVRVNI
jgi:hypothetical protein